ncbi:tol-pal system protein YbgF [Shewanella corallii]|uniref:Cell division coordinator CpoB n=2 Tax=Shewanella TaxID=22 RepID=A0ABT0NB01_9GAMM|nr:MULTISPECIES: tol-pal system protein YbgF [Shewanella]MCL1039773.1 tol-pal system protein YbgF [Shewanella submarina]MCL2915603.1 tol-pal system protein YbgF [Shewanella corallii]
MKKAVLASLIFMSAGTAIAAPAPVEDLAGGNATDRVARLERIIKAKQQADFELQSRVDTLQQEVLDLRGLVEQQNYQLNQMLERQRQLYDEIAQLQSQKNSVAVTPVATAPISTGTGAATSTLNETASYQHALDLVRKERKYDEAIVAFDNFIKQYPNSTLIANANYWLGQLLYNKSDFTAAKQAFSAVVTRYKDSNKRADSLLKLGLIAEKTGDKVEAKNFYQQVQREYADTSSARIAGQQLAGLKG